MKQGPVIVASDHFGSDNARIRMGLPDFLRIPDNNELRARLPLYRVHDWLNHHGGVVQAEGSWISGIFATLCARFNARFPV